MNQDPLTLYKLIVLYMLNRVTFPLTKAQVCDFILEKEYTNFMTLQQAISELMDADMLYARSIRNRTHLEITESGRETLDFFHNRISSTIKTEIDNYFLDNEFELKSELSVYSTYYPTSNGEYSAELVVKEKEVELINLKLSVPAKELAVSICDKWESKHEDIYKYVIEKLF
ncbi:MAG: DUF4364 family protein [Lachnospiraceae bacterium]|nr:DUF4364 family protein [Lachnospiraceae bacterium]